jgi:poly-gamma-glutamate synthesis protein (capsule biosynthesis protein)
MQRRAAATAAVLVVAAAGLAWTEVACCDDEPAAADGEAGAGDGPPPAAEEPVGGAVTLAFAGEIHFEGVLRDLPGRPGATLGPMSRELRSADVAVVNLESALAAEGTGPARKELEVPDERYWFRAPPEALEVLERSGVDVASMANNHGADFGPAGLRQSLAADVASDVEVIGIGRDPDQAYAPYRTRVRGTDVAVIAADASPRESADATWAVGPGTGIGIAAARSPGALHLRAAVREAAETDDVVVVYLHWGEEGSDRPTALQRRLARVLAEEGADVVVGTHAHVQVGSGMLGETYISYGLGDFAWYHGRRPDTGVLRLTVRGGVVEEERWRPGRIPPGGGLPRPLRGADARAAGERWDALRVGTGLTGVGDDESPSGLPAYASTVEPLGPELRRRMRGVSHDPATCPVGWNDLRLLTTSHVGFDGKPRTGRLVVNADVVGDVRTVFRALYRARFPIRRVRLVDAYDGSDDRSMAANNTSAYNCRRVAGQTTWSDHAFGRAVDINPVQNPYVTEDGVLPPAGRRYADVDRSSGASTAPGVIGEGSTATVVFDRLGWEWGGRWGSPDYQHFSAPGG